MPDLLSVIKSTDQEVSPAQLIAAAILVAGGTPMHRAAREVLVLETLIRRELVDGPLEEDDRGF